VRTCRDVCAGAGIAFGVVSAFATFAGSVGLVVAAAVAGVGVLVAARRFERLEAARAGPRTFTPLDRVRLVDALGVAPKGRVAVVSAAPDGESVALAEALSEALTASGFQVFGPLVPQFPITQVGVRIGVHRDDGRELAVKVAEVLVSAGIDCAVERDVPQGELFTVLVGRKP
jgi:hypothetical protein